MDSSSGAQGFLANLAIRDALHYASKLPKSSMCIIDEGFGKLDPEITINMQEPLNYLKNKYRNVFVVTHKDIVKDFMDNIIVVSKSKDEISTENQIKYPQAWTTQITVK
jgi:DNA repair exonuclease SbcCD ATPase subunit